MANVSKAKKDQVTELHANGHDVEYIKDITGLQVKTIGVILGLDTGDITGVKTEEETPEEEPGEESVEYWKSWAEFWEGKYLAEHAKLIKLEAVQEG